MGAIDMSLAFNWSMLIVWGLVVRIGAYLALRFAKPTDNLQRFSSWGRCPGVFPKFSPWHERDQDELRPSDGGGESRRHKRFRFRRSLIRWRGRRGKSQRVDEKIHGRGESCTRGTATQHARQEQLPRKRSRTKPRAL